MKQGGVEKKENYKQGDLPSYVQGVILILSSGRIYGDL